MKNLPSKILFFLIVGISISIFVTSCDGRPKGVLSKNDMSTILFEMHKLDGSLDAFGYSENPNQLKESYYKSLFEKYDITQAEFDSSLIWYSKNPKQFEKIYITVYDQLNQLNEDVKKGKFHPVDSAEYFKTKINLWNKSVKYNFTKDSARTKLNFEIKNENLLYRDVYSLTFLQRIDPKDSCENQQVLFCINYFNGKVDSVSLKTYNDSLLRRYSIRFPAIRKLKIKSISGELLGSKKYRGEFLSSIDSISLMREFRTDWQDSLKKIVQKNDPIIYKDKTDIDSLSKVKGVTSKFIDKVKEKTEK